MATHLELRRALIEAARDVGCAPSIFDTQPWTWRNADDQLQLWLDRSPRLPATDPDERQLTTSCGCALHHARLALAAAGCRTDVHYADDSFPDGLLATVSVTDAHPADAAHCDGHGACRGGGLDDAARYVAVIVGTEGNQPADRQRAAETVRVLLPAMVRAGQVVSVHPQVSQVPAAHEHLRLLPGRTGTPQLVVITGPIAAGRRSLGLPPVSALRLREPSVTQASMDVHGNVTGDR